MPAPALFIYTDAGTAPPQAIATPTTTATPGASASVPALPPASAASASLLQAFQTVPSIASTSTRIIYGQTGHTLGGIFKTYGEELACLEQFGYPITEE